MRDGHSIETLMVRDVPFEQLPEWYRDCPELEPWDTFYTNAFWRLSTERAVGFSMGAIPHSKVVEYGYEHGLNPATMQLLEVVIRRMDETYLEWSSSQQSRARQANKQPQIPVRGGKTKRPKPRA